MKLNENDNEEAQRRARLRGHLNGNPPYNPERLEELGLGYITNTNFLEMRAILDSKAGMSFELFFETDRLISCELSPAIRAQLPDQQQPSSELGMVVAEEFTRTVMSWPGFLMNLDIARREADLIGLGPVLFPDELGWQFKAFMAGSFRVPGSTKLDPNQWPICVFKDSISAGDLFRMALDKPEIGKKAGWDAGAVKDTLKRVYLQLTGTGQQVTEKYRATPWEEVEHRIRNKDHLTEVAAFEDVQVVHMLVAEVDSGEVSHYIFAETAGVELDNFLFCKERRFEKMEHAVWLWPFNSAGGTVRACRGLASFLEPHCDLSNRFLGRMFDAGFTASSLLLQPKTATDMSKLQIIRAGMMTVVPPELTIIQGSFAPPIQPLINLREVSSGVMLNNTGIYKVNPEAAGEAIAPKTARQVVEETSKEARAEKSSIAFDYIQLEKLYRELFRRLTNPKLLRASAEIPGKKEAIEFVQRCQMRGVSQDLLLTEGVFEVHAARAIGLGSPSARMDITSQLVAIAPKLDEQGQINAVRDYLAARVGYSNVDRFKPIKNRDLIPSNEMSIATLENNDFARGQTCVVGSDQFHTIHIAVHGQVLEGYAQAMQQSQQTGAQFDAQTAAATLTSLLPHFQMHVQYLAQDPQRKPLVDAAVKQLKSGMQMLKILQAVAEQQSKQLQDQQQAQMEAAHSAGATQQSAESQIKLREMEQDYALKLEKLKSLNQMREDKTAQGLELARQRAAAEIQLKAQLQAAKIRIDTFKAQADVQTKAAKARA